MKNHLLYISFVYNMKTPLIHISLKEPIPLDKYQNYVKIIDFPIEGCLIQPTKESYALLSDLVHRHQNYIAEEFAMIWLDCTLFSPSVEAVWPSITRISLSSKTIVCLNNCFTPNFLLISLFIAPFLLKKKNNFPSSLCHQNPPL